MEFQDFGSSITIYQDLDRATGGVVAQFILDCHTHGLEPKVLALTPKEGWKTPSILLHGADKNGDTAIFDIIPVSEKDKIAVWKLRSAERLRMPTMADILNLPEPVSRDN